MSGPPAKRRGRAETSPARVRHADRVAQALRLRIAGHSSPEIGRQLGVSRETAWKLIREALTARREEIAERTEELRAIEHERIEEYIAQLRPRALAGDMAAHRALLRWHERLARLLDLDLQREEIVPDVKIEVLFESPDRRESREAPVDAEFEEVLPRELGVGDVAGGEREEAS